MSISVKDNRLLKGSQKARRKLQGLEYGGLTREIIHLAESILEESTADFERVLNRAQKKEELEELLSNKNILANPKSRAGETAARLYYLLQWRYSERRAKGEPITDRDQEIEEFLTNFSPSGFLNASFPSAVDSLERATELAGQLVPDEVKNLSETAKDQIEETRSQLEEMSEQAIDAYTNLQEARDEARNRYLAARELTSAALRLEGEEDRLNEVTPPIGQILSPND